MLDDLTCEEMEVALAAVKSRRQTLSYAEYEKALLDSGDWTAIESRARESAGPECPIVPWRTYTSDNPHSHNFYQVGLFGFYREPHPMAPVVAKGSRHLRMARQPSRREYAERVWLRWARMTKLTWLDRDVHPDVPVFFNRIRHNGYISVPPMLGRDAGHVWLRGKYIRLTFEQIKIVKQMLAVIEAVEDPRDRAKAMRAWRIEQQVRI